ncbi:hypothetical protein BO71DRAFT_334888 [Aspergillus ellipticus CBS 707.79]|uniref:Uncharacterized protein n=1 Tax=Aspergillus ellipticus CBS 707.79 TaxID=1448320 RepID=A0A319DGQ4_9EURO|nr:hypothetical protein BO71DRAFT_334888 [Aspergillus ellipticus CBS 707.79]
MLASTRLSLRLGAQTLYLPCIPSESRQITSTARKLTDSRGWCTCILSKPVLNESVEKSGKLSNSEPHRQKSTVKSVTQADKELRERMEQMSGDGGAAGIEYEDGKPTAMKRSVRNNMFRYI